MRNHARKTVACRLTVCAAPAAAFLMILSASAATAQSQTDALPVPLAADDGWDFVENAATVAAGITCGGGQSLIVRCENGSLYSARTNFRPEWAGKMAVMYLTISGS